MALPVAALLLHYLWPSSNQVEQPPWGPSLELKTWVFVKFESWNFSSERVVTKNSSKALDVDVLFKGIYI